MKTSWRREVYGATKDEAIRHANELAGSGWRLVSLAQRTDGIWVGVMESKVTL